MTIIPKGCETSLKMKEVIEKTIVEHFHIDLNEFNIHDYDRNQLNKIIDAVNIEWVKTSDKMINKIIWEDFYHWYMDYH